MKYLANLLFILAALFCVCAVIMVLYIFGISCEELGITHFTTVNFVIVAICAILSKTCMVLTEIISNEESFLERLRELFNAYDDED